MDHKRLFATFIFTAGCTLQVSAQNTEIQQLAQLNQAGQPQQAYTMALNMLAEWEGEPAFDLQYGLAAVDSGMVSEGIFALERVLMAQPDNDYVRLEVGRAHFAVEEDDRARQEFERVLANDPPREVRENVRPYLDTIQARAGERRTTWAGYTETLLAPPNNIFLDSPEPGAEGDGEDDSEGEDVAESPSQNGNNQAGTPNSNASQNAVNAVSNGGNGNAGNQGNGNQADNDETGDSENGGGNEISAAAVAGELITLLGDDFQFESNLDDNDRAFSAFWGRWSGPNSNGNNLDDHFAYSSDVTASLPQSGTLSYSLLGATAPTDQTGKEGQVNSIDMLIDFTAQSIQAMSMNLETGTSRWEMSNSGVASLGSGANIQIDLEGSCFDSCAKRFESIPASGSSNISLVGPGAEGALGTYDLNAGSATAVGAFILEAD